MRGVVYSYVNGRSCSQNITKHANPYIINIHIKLNIHIKYKCWMGPLKYNNGGGGLRLPPPLLCLKTSHPIFIFYVYI